MAEVMPASIVRRADISASGTYRYLLTRRWGPGRFVAFVMLNPSKADGEVDDPTVRKCMHFARLWGFDAMAVVNVLAYRATDPLDLPRNLERATGPRNEEVIEFCLWRASLIVPAWGVPRRRFEPAYRNTQTIIQRVSTWCEVPVECLGLTKDRYPRHPLYVRYDTLRLRWPGLPNDE